MQEREKVSRLLRLFCAALERVDAEITRQRLGRPAQDGTPVGQEIRQNMRGRRDRAFPGVSPCHQENAIVRHACPKPA